jgi:transposase
MIAVHANIKVVVAAQAVDFRKSVHTLSALVSEALRASPVQRRRLRLPVQTWRPGCRVKLLAWDGCGMVLVTKWLSQGSFTWSPIRDGVVSLTAAQLTMLLAGLDSTRVAVKALKQPVLAA